MWKASELIRWLEERYPVCYAESWDNVGLLVGRDDKEVRRVFLTLDLTDETLREALEAGADMILTHHPLIFGSIQKINNHSALGRRILTLIREDLPCYAIHTNYDVRGMAGLSADRLQLRNARVLSVTKEGPEGKEEGFGRVGELPKEMTLEECARFVKEAFAIPQVQVYGELNRTVSRAAVCTGSGKSMIGAALSAGAQVYITGDVDHHTGIDTRAEGMGLIDAGHYGTEYIFMEAVGQAMKEAYPALAVITAKKELPYAIL